MLEGEEMVRLGVRYVEKELGGSGMVGGEEGGEGCWEGWG